ncbi:MAG TPA: DUF4861 family protein [Rhodothermales bacterium]
MKEGPRHGLLLLIVLALASGCRSPEAPRELTIEVFNPHPEQWLDAPVMLRLENYPVALEPFARVYRNHGGTLTEVPSQLDDVDRDGTPDQLFFLVDLDANETARYVVRPDSERTVYPTRVWAALLPLAESPGQPNSLRETLFSSDTVATGDARGAVAAVRWASERVEYRATLSEPDLTDALLPSSAFPASRGDATVREVDSAADSSRPESAARTVADAVDSAAPAGSGVPASESSRSSIVTEVGGAPPQPGIDVLDEGTVLGLGSPALATRDGFVYLARARRVSVDVVANGPLRAVVRTTYEGVPADDVMFDLVVEREIHAGSRWTDVRVFVADSLGERRLITGIPRTPDGPRLQSGSSHGAFYLYTLGPMLVRVRAAVAERASRLSGAGPATPANSPMEGVVNARDGAPPASKEARERSSTLANAAGRPSTNAAAYSRAQSHPPESLAVVLLVPERLHPRLQPDALLDHRVHFAAENEAATYRYMAAWDEGPEDTMTDASMLQRIAEAAARWMTPVQVSVDY